MEKLRVLAQSVHDHLSDTGMKVDLGNELVLFNDIIQLAVGEKNQLLWCCIDLLSHICLLCRVCCLGAGLTLAQDLGKLLDAFSLLNLLHNAVAFLDQIGDDLFKQAHAGVLAGVSELVQVVLEVGSCTIVQANVNQTGLKYSKLARQH